MTLGDVTETCARQGRRSAFGRAMLLSAALHGAVLLGLGGVPREPAPAQAPERSARVFWVRALAPEPDPVAPTPPPVAAPPPASRARVAPAERPEAAPPAQNARAARRDVPAAPLRSEASSAPVPSVRSEAPTPTLSSASASRSAAANAAAAASADAAPAAASLRDVRVVHREAPRYPRAARLRGAEGIALLRVHVATSGRVQGVDVERSAGDDELDRAAREAVRAWRFAPRAPGGSRDFQVLIPVEFRLR